MPPTATDPSVPADRPDPRELYERLERLSRRIAAMARERDAGDALLRRQRAAGRRP